LRNVLAASMVSFLSVPFPSAGTDDPAIHAPTATQIVDRIVSARGGAVGWQEMRSMVLSGKIDLSDFLFKKPDQTSCSTPTCGFNTSEEPRLVKKILSPVVESLPGGPELHLLPGNSPMLLFPVVCSLEVTTFTTARVPIASIKTPPSIHKEHLAALQSIEKEQTGSPERLPALTPVSLPQTPPLSPEPAEPRALHVSCEGDQLTIVADNSTLSEVLAEVSAQTRADIDIPAGASGERLANVRLGPGPAREVLTSLLSWTTFDYVIQASDANPQGIKSVFLVARSKTPTGGSAGTALASGRHPLASPPRRGEEPNLSFAETSGAQNPVSQQPATPAEVPPSEHRVATATQDSNANQSQSKTPQEMIDELQRMYQQRRQQMQQGQGQKPRTGV